MPFFKPGFGCNCALKPAFCTLKKPGFWNIHCMRAIFTYLLIIAFRRHFDALVCIWNLEPKHVLWIRLTGYSLERIGCLKRIDPQSTFIDEDVPFDIQL